MEVTSDFYIVPSNGAKPGAYASFPYDRDLVRRFRAAFPRARWREPQGCWFVPGARAEQRLNLWMSQTLDALDRHADAKGRDDFEFDPIASRYLEPADELVVRTPYSRTVVEQLRAVPWARWDPLERAWRVPYRSAVELRRRWPVIEEAAARNEPEARLARAAERTPDPLARRRQTDRRKQRYPVPGDDLPPFGEPVGTLFGVIIFEDAAGDPLTSDEAAPYPFAATAPERHVWATWRPPTFRELRAIPPREEREAADRGWWPPAQVEIDETRSRLGRLLRQREAASG